MPLHPSQFLAALAGSAASNGNTTDEAVLRVVISDISLGRPDLKIPRCSSSASGEIALSLESNRVLGFANPWSEGDDPEAGFDKSKKEVRNLADQSHAA